jgi:hypothetical protein
VPETAADARLRRQRLSAKLRKAWVAAAAATDGGAALLRAWGASGATAGQPAAAAPLNAPLNMTAVVRKHMRQVATAAAASGPTERAAAAAATETIPTRPRPVRSVSVGGEPFNGLVETALRAQLRLGAGQEVPAAAWAWATPALGRRMQLRVRYRHRRYTHGGKKKKGGWAWVNDEGGGGGGGSGAGAGKGGESPHSHEVVLQMMGGGGNGGAKAPAPETNGVPGGGGGGGGGGGASGGGASASVDGGGSFAHPFFAESAARSAADLASALERRVAEVERRVRAISGEEGLHPTDAAGADAGAGAGATEDAGDMRAAQCEAAEKVLADNAPFHSR